MLIRKILKLGIPALEKLRYRQEPLERQFESIILRHLRPDHIVLDAGCGIYTYAHIKGKCRMVIGVDADKSINRNNMANAIIHADLNHLPFPDNTFDIVMSWTVLEHIEDPQICFREISRVCKPGGLTVHTTPNMLHYANLFIKATPYSFHKWFIHKVIGANDFPYPTLYKINTPKRLEKIVRMNGFTPVETRLIDMGPIYLNWLTPAYAIVLIYHHIVNYFSFLSCLRGFIIGVSLRQSTNETGDKYG